MSKPAKRRPMEGQPREYQALLNGKPQAMHYQTADAAFIDVRDQEWEQCSIVQLVYSAGSWHYEGVAGRYMKTRSGKIVPLMKMSDTTHTQALTEGKQK